MWRKILSLGLSLGLAVSPALARDEHHGKSQPRQEQQHSDRRGGEMQRHRFDNQGHGAVPQRHHGDQYQDRDRHQDRDRDRDDRHWRGGHDRYYSHQQPRYIQRPYHRPYQGPRYWNSYRHHYYLYSLPVLAISFAVGGVTYYSAYDNYYRWAPDFGYYQQVDPDLIWVPGTIVDLLPGPAVEVWVGNTLYLQVDGIFFLPLDDGRYLVARL
ncbi:hypothetical protein PVT67_08740 [Gallaecimonas kandeliae]|uniref:hypothetical protein n=1 Tax=Gallaecimonas kandeliae TaxID=3029055 RepID=UPI0026492E37|nr:hypothetical protein [Gallaecimonas kandeliae]WKE67300.1 hypothetical protein PVT67_08740 [Gallaecimonas kandeliae]